MSNEEDIKPHYFSQLVYSIKKLEVRYCKKMYTKGKVCVID